jgi:hypothetical protein
MSKISISENEIKDQLLYETICRKQRKWPLLTPEKLSTMWERQKPLRDPSYKIESKYLIIPPKSQCFTEQASKFCDVEKLTIERLESSYPYILELLSEFPQLIACGGSIFKHLHQKQNNNDIDLFFVDEEVEKHGNHIYFQEKQSRLLMTAVKFLADKWLSHKSSKAFPGHDYEDNWTKQTKVFIKRSTHVTTVYLHEHDEYFTFQFIHRVYPSIGSILGGFDLSPCKIGCDGKHIYATELGAWSAFGRLLIIDTQTRSVSFETRISKYNTYCSTIFPGLLYNSLTNKVSPEQVLYEIHEFLRKNNYVYAYDSNLWGLKMRFDLCQIPMPNLEKYVEKKIKKKGYVLKKLKVEPIKSYTSNEIFEKISKISERYGYRLTQEKKELAVHDGYREFPSFVIESRTNQMRYKFYSRRRMQSDYDVHFDKTKTDYDMSTDNYFYIGDMNASMLRCGNLEHVSALLTLSKLDTLFFGSTYMDNNTGWKNIKASLVNITNMQEEEIGIIYENFFGLTPNNNFILKHLCVAHDVNAYPTRVLKFLARLNSLNINSNQQQLLIEFRRNAPKLLAEHTNEVMQIIKSKLLSGESFYSSVQTFVSMLLPILAERVAKNAIIATEMLSNVKWTVTNPGRQWTSSINPIIKDPRDWYGERYTRFTAYDENYESQLRLLFLRHPFSQLPKDILKIILLKVIMFGNGTIPNVVKPKVI